MTLWLVCSYWPLCSSGGSHSEHSSWVLLTRINEPTIWCWTLIICFSNWGHSRALKLCFSEQPKVEQVNQFWFQRLLRRHLCSKELKLDVYGCGGRGINSHLMELVSNVLLQERGCHCYCSSLKLKTETCEEYKYLLQNRGGSLLWSVISKSAQELQRSFSLPSLSQTLHPSMLLKSL